MGTTQSTTGTSAPNTTCGEATTLAWAHVATIIAWRLKRNIVEPIAQI
jgi:hypothetical protein